MKNFKTHIKTLNESAPNATEWETVITDAYNGNFTNIEKQFGKQYIDPAKQIANEIKKIPGIGKPMVHSGKKTGTMDPDWKGKNDAKTDVYVGNYHISLKNAEGSQFMSASADETKSTFRAACRHMKNEAPDEINKLINKVNSAFERVFTEYSVDDMKKILDTKVGSTITATVHGEEIKAKVTKELRAQAEAMVNLDASNKKLTKTFQDFFSDNTKFKEFFVYEAATGDIKYYPDPICSANWLCTWGRDGKAKVEEISKGHSKPGKAIPNYASRAKVYVAFKSTTSGAGYRSSSFRVGLSKTVLEYARPVPKEPTIIDVIAETMYDHGFHTLSEEYLTEWEFLSKIKNFFVSVVKNIYNMLVEIARKGYQAIMDFLGIEVDTVSASLPDPGK